MAIVTTVTEQVSFYSVVSPVVGWSQEGINAACVLVLFQTIPLPVDKYNYDVVYQYSAGLEVSLQRSCMCH